MKIAIAHPDLGIGGAERLIVDAAVGLVGRGHDVILYTSHHDPEHSFSETTDGSLRVVVYGDFFPTNVFGRFKIVCATIKALYLAGRLSLLFPYPDVILFDQVSAYACLFRLMRVPLVFYCHFPDQLLSSRTSLLKAIYRFPFDIFEQATTALADCIMVNSQFTRSVFSLTFPLIKTVPEVLYPSINLEKYSTQVERDDSEDLPPRNFDASSDVVFLSINRFERKKGIELALNAFCLLSDQFPSAPIKLVIAGGYDPRMAENVEYEIELMEIAALKSRKISYFPDMAADVIFLRSFTDQQRSYLLKRCACVLYTPQNEHFGIVPVEAMYASRPVIAANSGGPLESIIDGKTGYLCEPIPSAFASRMKDIIENPAKASQMGEKGRQHVIDRFSLDAFSTRLSDIIEESCVSYSRRKERVPYFIIIVVIVSIIIYALMKKF